MKITSIEYTDLNKKLNEAADADTPDKSYKILNEYLEDLLNNQMIECKSVEYRK